MFSEEEKDTINDLYRAFLRKDEEIKEYHKYKELDRETILIKALKDWTRMSGVRDEVDQDPKILARMFKESGRYSSGLSYHYCYRARLLINQNLGLINSPWFSFYTTR